MKRIAEVTERLISELRHMRIQKADGLQRSEPVRVLVVEDNPDDAFLETRALEAVGCNVDVARDGNEAVDKLFTSTHPDILSYEIVFLDLNLPGTPGVEILRKIRAIAPDLPVVIITAPDHRQELREAMKMGYAGYVEKPLQKDDVREIITKHRLHQE